MPSRHHSFCAIARNSHPQNLRISFFRHLANAPTEDDCPYDKESTSETFPTDSLMPTAHRLNNSLCVDGVQTLRASRYIHWEAHQGLRILEFRGVKKFRINCRREGEHDAGATSHIMSHSLFGWYCFTYTGFMVRSSIVPHCLQNRRSDLYRSSSVASLLFPVSAR